MTVKFKDLGVGQRFKFRGNPTVMRKLRCPNDPTRCYALCVTGNVIHEAGDLFVSNFGDGDYSEQEMLVEDYKDDWE